MDAAAPRAVILVSGGLDSATTLAIACDEGFVCHALSFDYGQRHRQELDAARRVAASMNVVEHRLVNVDLRAFGGSALTEDTIAVPKDRVQQVPRIYTNAPSPPARLPGGEGSQEIPVTYVPARNTIFLSFALGYAEVIDARHIFIGVNAIDYSGYPDCRSAFIRAFEAMSNLATKMGVEAVDDAQRIRIHTPLIEMTKAQIIRKGMSLGVEYGLTLSCYDPDDHGRPCGRCDSCRLRAEGFRAAGVDDPVMAQRD